MKTTIRLTLLLTLAVAAFFGILSVPVENESAWLASLRNPRLSASQQHSHFSVSDNERGEISWNAFCNARGYDRNDNTHTTVNEYLDTWCGSVEEENAFITAGVNPY